MTNDELFAVITKGLYVDEAVADATFRSRKRAEYLERAMYVCPDCGLTTFESHGNEIACKQCGKSIHYGADKRLSGVGCDFPYEFVSGWYDYQKSFINGLDVSQYTDTPLYTEATTLSEVIVYHRKESICKNATVCLYGDRYVIDGAGMEKLTLPFSEVTAVSVLGRNKLNIYHNNRVYQLKSDPRFNALKYVNVYYRWKNIVKGDENGEFLGL